MKNKFTVAAALGAAALALSPSHAGAQQVTASVNELLLCFQATGGTGSTINLELDLGNFASPISAINIDADLDATYGSNWASRTDLFWGVIGTNYQTTPPTAYTVFVDSPDTAGAGTDNSLVAGSGSAQQPPAIDTNNGYGLFNSANATAGDTTRTETVDNTTGGSFGEDFGAYNSLVAGSEPGGTILEGMPDDGSFTGGLALADIWELNPGTPVTKHATDIGFVSLGDTGEVTLNGASAVPEPSAWASIVLGAATLIGLRRRRSIA
jgi:hypothetical protein